MPDELVHRQTHDARLARSAVVLPAERHMFVGELEQTVVGNRYAMCVAAQIIEDLLGASERLLGIDYPLGSARLCQTLDESAGLGQLGKRREEPQLAGVEGLLQTLKEQPPKQPREHAHWQEKAGPAGEPAFAIRR